MPKGEEQEVKYKEQIEPTTHSTRNFFPKKAKQGIDFRKGKGLKFSISALVLSQINTHEVTMYIKQELQDETVLHRSAMARAVLVQGASRSWENEGSGRGGGTMEVGGYGGEQRGRPGGEQGRRGIREQGTS